MRRAFINRLTIGLGLVALSIGASIWLGWNTSPANDQPVTRPATDKPANDEPISFNRDIRPILSDKCFACHGPDAAIAKDAGGFRLDNFEDATKPAASGDRPIVPGDADASEILNRLTHTNAKLVMPPPKAKLTITEEEIALLRKWINQGAEYEGHWAYETPAKPALPEVKHTDWLRDRIDHFIAARIEKAGLTPSPEADRATLIRRASLDLIGLPPTPEESDAFVKDKSPDAYEKVVDRLLANPHFGERMALVWLDAARYADTIGYQLDHFRSSWPYRNYVIDSFNKNKPYDVFIIEQLAGDMLPDATDEQKLATAFCRMHMMNHEGGSIDEEFRVTAVADRIETIGTVFMAQTYNCAMCHDHKYDPIAQQDYYNLFKYFHNINERGVWTNKPERAIAYGDRLNWYPPEQKAQLAKAQAEVNRAIKAREDATPEAAKQQATWEQSLRDKHGVRWAKSELTDIKSTQVSATFEHKADGSVLLNNRDSPGAEDLTLTYRTDATGLRLIKLDALTDPWNGDQIGRSDAGDAQPTHIKITATSIKDPSKSQQVKLKLAWATQANKVKDKVLDAENILKPGKPGWSIGGKHDGVPKTLLLIADEAFGFEGGTKVTVWIEQRSGLSRRTLGRLRLGFASADATVADVLPTTPGKEKQTAIDLTPLALIDPAKRTAHGSKIFSDQWRGKHSKRFVELSSAVAKAEKALKAITSQSTPVTIMKELAKPKDMFVLERGEYSKPIKDRPAKLTLPSFIDLPLPEGAPNNRLGFAKWLTRPDHPLTSRVQVNRLWQMFFGTGIVKTVEDFGSQADWPSHPELLDDLAVDFAASGWDNKALIKRIVMSATYRQQAITTPKALAIDQDNRLLSHFPRRRLPGELIRDQALAVSGLLNETIGGPSVKPYQPEGLWREVSMGPRSNTNIFKRDNGDKLYRRSIYTFIKRKSPPPQMQTFGAPNREACVVDRGLTNTPLQALVLWNDEQFLEAARVLAQRTTSEAKDDDARLSRMYQRATGEVPPEQAITILRDTLQHYRQRYAEAPDDAKTLLSQGEFPLPNPHEPAELAAWMMVANTILALDETIVRD